MGDVLRKIEEIEAEMARTQKNKATSAHLGQLKAKLAKLRRELITPKSQGGSAKEESFEVAKTGDSRIGESDSLTPHYAMTMTIYSISKSPQDLWGSHQWASRPC